MSRALCTDQARNIYLKPKKAGGMKITFQAPPKNLDEKMLYNILRDYKMLNCEVLVRDENGISFIVNELYVDLIQIATVDDFIDVIMKDHRKYIKWCVMCSCMHCQAKVF